MPASRSKRAPLAFLRIPPHLCRHLGFCPEEVTPTPRDFHNPLPLLPRSLLLVGIVALTLFVVGPQAGSLDDDGDGSPDIPIVVSDATLAADASQTADVDQRSQNVRGVHKTIQNGIQPRHIGICKSNFASLHGRSVLRSSCLLRC